MNPKEQTHCPGCHSSDVQLFYKAENVPVNSVLLLRDQKEALDFPSAPIELGFCHNCAFIYNVAFRPELLEYSERYEGTQAFSPTFQTWHKTLAQNLIDRHNLRGKKIVEIGCGQGEFLEMLCTLGENQGLGFDPAYQPQRSNVTSPLVQIVPDFYGPRYARHHVDFLCCKMTLEHIPQTAQFLEPIRQCLKEQPETIVFFQVPDVLRILQDLAFWDVYYEHCSYFGLGSIARLFRRSGFDVLHLSRDYDGQYLMIEARPTQEAPSPPLAEENDQDQLQQLVHSFAPAVQNLQQQWQQHFQRWQQKEQKVVLWGGGSKAVSFLTALPPSLGPDFVVEINPHKHGCFLPQTGQPIVGPDFLVDYKPDAVVIVNPIYRDEIRQDLQQRGLTPELVTL